MSTRVVELILAGPRRSRLVSDALGVLVLNVVTVALNFATVLVLARFLGVAAFGAYAFAIAWARLLGVPAMLGLPSLVTRTVAAAHVHGDWGRMHGIMRRASQMTVGASVAAIAVAAPVGWVFLRDDLAGPFVIALVLLPVLGLTSVRQAAMQGLGRVVLGRMPETLLWPSLFLASFACAEALGGNLGAAEVVGLHVASATVALVIGTWLLRRSLPPEARGTTPVYETRVWLRAAFPFTLAAGIGTLNAQIGVVLLGFMIGPAASGTYAVASRAANFVTFLFTTTRYAVTPAIARLHAQRREEQLQRTVTRAAQAILVSTLPVALAMFLFADVVARLFGTAFEDAAGPLRLLSIGQLAVVAMGYAAVVLAMTGNEVPMTKPMAIGTLVNVALSPLFISLWGVEGAAAATTIGIVLTNTGLAVVARRRTRIYTPPIRFSRMLS